MFTIDKIKAEHRKVKSGTDFPKYIQAIKKMGVSRYTVNVADGNTEYFDQHGHSVSTGAEYDMLTIAENPDPEHFKLRLQLHQQGGTDYRSFCKDCARNGIKGWNVNLNTMTCTYLDKTGNDVLTEQIPDINH